MATPLRILIIEDSEDDAHLLLLELKRAGYAPEYERVQSEQEMRAALARGPWDLVISDYSMPGFSGTQALALLRGGGFTTPFIFVSGTIGEETAVSAMRSGAQDYVLKGNLARLAPAIDRELRDAKARQEQERAQAALRATEARLRHVIASIGAVIYELRVVEGEARLQWISENLTRILGYTSTEALAPQWWLQHVHPDDREWLRPAGAPFPAHDRVVEYRFRHKDGTYRWIRDEQRMTRDGEGNVELVGAWLDITSTKLLEEQFRQAQKMEAVGRLAGGIAHDFNNLLTAITGYAELLRQDVPGDDPRREDIDEIIKAAQRAATLTHQLLAFSRQQVLQPRVVDLNEVVAGMDKLLRRIIGEDVDLLTDLDPELSPVRADPGQLEQVIVNLAVNSRDAMPQGGKLTIETANAEVGEAPAGAHRAVPPGSYVMVAVSDTGIGMDEKTRAHIFEPFFTTKEPGKGTGLGLATVYGIVQQSGGHVLVYSEPGRGTTFKLYVPRVEEAAEHLVPKEVPDEVQGGTETILLVEDEAGVRKLARQVLERRGYHLLEASNADEALVICHQHSGPIHLLVTDIVMPGVSGAEAADELRRIKPGMKVLYMSGYPDRAVTHHRILDPDVPFLQKPFAPDTLARKVHEALEKN